MFMEGSLPSNGDWYKATELYRHEKLIICLICAVHRLLQPWEQALPGRRHYTNGLRCLERRIHSMTRLKLYSKIKVDTDSQTARAMVYRGASWYIPENNMIRNQNKRKQRAQDPLLFLLLLLFKIAVQIDGSAEVSIAAFFSVLYLNCKVTHLYK